MARGSRLIFLILALGGAGVPLLAGPGNFPVSTGTPADPDHRYNPAIAYNSLHDEYLVVWHNTWSGGNRDVYGQRVGPNGEFRGPWFAVSPAGPDVDSAEPAVAYDRLSDQYLVVWRQYSSLPPPSAPCWDIRGRLMPWDGPGTGSYIFIHSTEGATSGWSPSVANDPVRSRFVVTWDLSTAINDPFVRLGVSYRLVENNGGMSIARTASGGTDPYQNDVTYNSAADEYLVVWRNGATEIAGARINAASGLRVDPEFALHTPSSNLRQNPSIATDTQGLYMAAWEIRIDVPTIDWDIHGALLQPVNPSVGILGELSIAAGTEDEASPEVVATSDDGRTFTVLWQEPRPDGWQRIARAGLLAWIQAGNIWGLLFPLSSVFDESGSQGLDPAATASALEMVAVFRRVPSTGSEHIYGWTPVVFRDGFETGTFSRWSMLVSP